VYAFAFQIYFDFSGYTDIAIGLALLFGFAFPKNFDHPYCSTSFQEFWRRWHMTLSRWLRDYLYIALGGNRRGAARTTANLMTTMLLGGLWHGASWNYVVWGGLHGVYLALERSVAKRLSWWRSAHWFATAVRWVLVSQLVCLAWVFFRAPNLAAGLTLLARIGRIPGVALPLAELEGLGLLLAGLLALHFAMARWRVKERLAEAGAGVFGVVAAAMLLALIWFTPAKTVPFIYFQF
jgi:D-alanyl-lipoteichoic acid acyltransferase DltB (MBOAT superfamily)